MSLQAPTLKGIIDEIKTVLEIQNNGEEYKDYSSLECLSPVSYSLIASFHKKNVTKYKLNRDSFHPKISAYMDRVGLFTALRMDSFWSSIFGRNKNLIEVTHIDSGRAAEEVTTKFIDGLKESFQTDSEKETMRENEILDNSDYCLKELFNNILNHSTDYHTNYSAGEYYVRELIHFAVVDSGVGIKRDISHTFSDITSHKQAIIRAMGYGNSGKITREGISVNQTPYSLSENAGIGLTAVSTIVRKNGGDIVIGTGNYMYVYDSETGEEFFTKIAPWNGTFVFFNMYYGKMNIYDYASVLRELQGTTSENLSALETVDFIS